MRLTTKSLQGVMGLFLFLLSVTVVAQNKLTPAQWQEDLKFLQETVNNDFSFLFKKVTSDNWNAAVEKLNKDIPNMQDHEVMMGFARIISMFKYGHTSLGLRGGKVDHHKIPINLYHFNDGVYIEGTTKGNEEALGAKVLKVGSHPIDKALELIYPSFPAENEQFFKAWGVNHLTVPEILHAQRVIPEYTMDVTYTLEKDGKTFEHTFTAGDKDAIKTMYSLTKVEGEAISARNQEQTPLFVKELDKIYHFEYLEDQKTVYVRQSQIQDDPSEDIPTFYAKVFDFIEKNDVERFVLDVRLNGGGNNYKNKPVITGIIQSKINEVGKFYCIIGRRTFSACQNLVNELHNYTNVIFVGEPTGENINFYGDNQPVKLPNSEFTAYLSFAWWQDKPQWENQDWMPPNVFVDTSFEQYKNNQDPVLEAALTFEEGEGVVLDPMRYLTELFMAGEIDKVATEAQRLIKDPMHQFVDFEGEFAEAGNQLLSGGQVQEAAFVFDMTAKMFPDSAKVWFGFAETLVAADQKEEAKGIFAKVSALDPYGPYGEKARAALKKFD